MVAVVPSTGVALTEQRLNLMADYALVNYSGTLAQWQAFLARPQLRPRPFDSLRVSFDANQGLRYRSRRLALQLGPDVLPVTSASTLMLSMAYTLDGGVLDWGVGGVNVYRDDSRQNYIGLERHIEPADSPAAKDLLDAWRRMSRHGPGFQGVAAHNDDYTTYWIHDALGVPSASAPGNDPADRVLYDAYYVTNASVYPRDLEQRERLLLQDAQVLEH
jgi:hypothetical protein